MSEPDWADVEARKWCGLVKATSWDMYEPFVADIAAALRAAETRGIVRSAEYLEKNAGSFTTRCEWSLKLSNELRALLPKEPANG